VGDEILYRKMLEMRESHLLLEFEQEALSLECVALLDGSQIVDRLLDEDMDG